MIKKKLRKSLALLLAIVMAVGTLTILPVAVDAAANYVIELPLPTHGLEQESEVDSFEFEEISDELARSILTATLQGSIGMQGFEGDYALGGDPNEIVEIIVEFVTPSAVALRLMQERGISHNMVFARSAVSYEAQAQTGHAAFVSQLAQVPMPFSSEASIEILSEHYGIFNGMGMRVPAHMVAQIAALPEVYAVYPNWAIEDPEPIEYIDDLEFELLEFEEAIQYFDISPASSSSFFVDDRFMRETRNYLQIDRIHRELGITGAGVQVAVIDRGVDHNHPELQRFLVNGRIPGSTYNDLGERIFDNTYRPGNDHGMLVSGPLIAMAPGISFWHYRREDGTDSVLALLNQAHRDGAQVINMSFATQASVNHPFSRLLERITSLVVIDGVVLVASAGNNGELFSITSPGTEPLLITVGAGEAGGGSALAQNDPLRHNSSRGPVRQTYHIKPDIIAPGSRVLSITYLARSNTGFLRTDNTSLAAPIIAGVAALLLERFPDATPAEIKARIMNSTRPLAGQTPNNVFEVGAGFVRPLQALQSETFVTVEHYVPATNNEHAPFVSATMASLSFGNAQALRDQHAGSKTMRVTIHNTSNASRTYTISHHYTNNPDDAVQLIFDRRSITVPARQAANVYVTMTLNAGVVAAGTYGGYIYILGGNDRVRLPFGLYNRDSFTFTPSPAAVTTWAQLRAAISAAPANTPTTIRVAESFPAPTGAAGEAIIIPANRQITLMGAASTAQASFSTQDEGFILPHLYDNIEPASQSPIIGEDISLRDCEFTRHYLHEDGTVATALFVQPVNFLNNSGTWQDIDNTLQLQTDEDGNAVFVPIASGLDISIPQELCAEQLLSIAQDGYSVSFGLIDVEQSVQAQRRTSQRGQVRAVNASRGNRGQTRNRNEQIAQHNEEAMEAENLAAVVEFEEVLPGVDLEQIVTHNGVSEHIIINKLQEAYHFDFQLELDGLIPVVQEDGSFTLLSATSGEQVFALQAPVMFDAVGNTYAVAMELRDDMVTIEADAAWINAAVMPVTIVPMAVQAWTQSPIRDTYVNSSNNMTNPWINFVGRHVFLGISGDNRTLMQFDLRSIPSNHTIISANLQITQNQTYSFQSGMSMDIYQLASAIPANPNWSNQPARGSHISRQPIFSASGHTYNANITDAVRNWHANPANNHGIVIVSSDESRPTRVALASSGNLSTNNRPSLTVSHAPTVRTITQAQQGHRHFIVHGSLTLGSGITLSGGTATNSNNSGGVEVRAGGNFTMNTGSIIENCRRTVVGGAVSLVGSGTAASTRATFTLTGGTIRNNQATNGGGVNLGTNSRMTMSSGLIQNNATIQVDEERGGGGVRVNSSSATFEMTGGTIAYNATARFGGGVRVDAGGNLYMRGGTIRNNMAEADGGGVGVASATNANTLFHISGGIIENNAASNGGGVATINNAGTRPQIMMTNGIIRGNIATSNGGGVHVARGATFTMNGANARIENNNASSGTISTGGGGVNVAGSDTDPATRATFNLQNGTIHNNQGNSGGGIRVATNGRVNMTGGTISNNRSRSSTRGGGGVYVFSGTIAQGMGFNMTGGTISNNTAVNNGGGIFSTLYSTANPVPATAYANLHITAAARFSGNSSRRASAPPSNRLAHIATTASVSIGNYALNNHDINYTGS